MSGLEQVYGRLDRVNTLGCRLGVAALSDKLDQRWRTGVWTEEVACS